MKTGNTYHTTATPIRLTDPEIRSILAAPLRHIRRRVKPTPPDGWCPVVGEVLVAAQSIRELSAEVNEAEKDYALLELEANEYEEGRDRNAELWERVKAERDRLAGEVDGLKQAAQSAIEDLDGFIERCWKGGPDGPVSYIPEHDPAQAIIDALKSALAQAGQGGGTQP